MSEPIRSTAADSLAKECIETGAGRCAWDHTGYRVYISTWPNDCHQLIDRINAIPVESLCIEGTAIADRDFSLFRNTNSWKRLSLRYMPINGSGLDLLGLCEGVEEIEIRECLIDGKKLIGLRRFPNAVSVTLSGGTRSGDDALRYMQPLEHLQTLTVSEPYFSFTGDGLEGLSGKQHLNRIAIDDNRISRGLEHLINCPSLESLSLQRTHIDDTAMSHIAQINSIKKLWVGSDELTDQGLRHFAGHPQLETLGYCAGTHLASHLRITEECFVHLPKIPNLKGLSVACHVSQKGISILKQIPGLDYLDLCWPTLSRTELDQIRKQLPRCLVTSPFIDDEEDCSDDDED